ncbi:AAA family ATPase [Methylovorus menthalis]|uniref:AAA family ATPase n=1 Tax=Methylovorus menthalis TaxID=1002227 RepID=UPI001E2E77F6|nr:AAA family ATPase [Methylovorus menthalis]MCB4810591.1 AAA family ATPase [Methylovorus menthalis]
MRYIWMHNFRGFDETLVPLHKVSFLVGENSTGKSSFLNLYNLISKPDFWILPSFDGGVDSVFGGFDDIVSAWSKNKSFFEVGFVEMSEKNIVSIKLFKFKKRGGNTQICMYLNYEETVFTSIVFDPARVKYKIGTLSFQETDNPIQVFKEYMREYRETKVGYSKFPEGVNYTTSLPVLLSILRNARHKKNSPDVKRGFSYEDFSASLPRLTPFTWTAPIRTKPKRFYDGLPQTFTPEGDHAPYVLRRILKSPSSSPVFVEKLTNFGKASGLFETVISHSFGISHQSPFEILVKFPGAQLNINNVGYGVSQALPLVIEFLRSENKTIFAVQQPEVHLHPKAQAALGDLIFEVAADSESSFHIETHSDYLIDRYRLSLKLSQKKVDSTVLFFMRTDRGNQVFEIPIDENGRYSLDAPKEFKDFFIAEAMQLLEL